jgi:hypothetical protein
MRGGDTVSTPPGEKHWHGGTADTMMCHLAMLEGTLSGDGTIWLEPVTDSAHPACRLSPDVSDGRSTAGEFNAAAPN